MYKPSCPLLQKICKKEAQKTEKQYMDLLNDEFNNMFNKEGIFYKGKQVKYKVNPITDGYEEAFYHITHRDIYRKNVGREHRELDYARAEKIAWIKPIIENCPCSEINCSENIMIWKEGKKVYFYLKNPNYLVIIEERKNAYQLVTAYSVIDDKEKRRLKKRYTESKTKGGV